MVQNNQLLLKLFQKKLFSRSRPRIENQTFFYKEPLKAADLGEVFQISTSQVIKFFWDKGTVVSQNQNFSAELVNVYCQSRGIKATKQKEKSSFDSIIEEYLQQIEKKEDLTPRPPVVSVMGHIDHGKTTLLDTIQGSRVQEEEKGGITQKISIYQMKFQEKKIIFCDTPGHDDFIKMRQRGVLLTDLVVLLIDAKEGIMNQTKEIIDYLREYKLPVIVFINHKKPAETNNESNLIRLKSQLQKYGITDWSGEEHGLTEWGSDTLIISGNAREEKDAKRVCEYILLMSEVKQWKANYELPAHGLVINSGISTKLGKINTLLIKGGKLREKDLLLASGKIGKIKRMIDLQGKKVSQAFPSDPVQVVGLDFLAEAGGKFLAVSEDKFSKDFCKLLVDYQREKVHTDLPNQPVAQLSPEGEKQKIINLIVIADSQASLEVIVDLVKSKNIDGSLFQIVATSIGSIHEQLFSLAKNTQSYLFIFSSKLSKEIRQRFKENQFKWFQSEIIYEIEEKLTELIQLTREKKQIEKFLGTAEVIKVIYFSKIGNIAGCQVVKGNVERNNLVYVFRQGQKVFSGKIKSLEVEKEKVNIVKKGQECGIVLENFGSFQEKDQIISYRWEEEDVNWN